MLSRLSLAWTRTAALQQTRAVRSVTRSFVTRTVVTSPFRAIKRINSVSQQSLAVRALTTATTPTPLKHAPTATETAPKPDTTTTYTSTSIAAAAPHVAPHVTAIDPSQASAEWIRFYRSVHRPITPVQRAFLAVGSAVLGFLNTHRGDMISVLGDTTGAPVLRQLHQSMTTTEEGRRVLSEKPRILTTGIASGAGGVDFAALRALPPNTFGAQYAAWMDSHGYHPNDRSSVQFVDDPELAYVMQRYREVHDLWHVLVQCPTSVLGEVAQKWWEAVQTSGLPITVISSLIGPFRLSLAEQSALVSTYIPWALRSRTTINTPLLAVYWEEYFDQPIEQVRKRFGIEIAPPVPVPTTDATAKH